MALTFGPPCANRAGPFSFGAASRQRGGPFFFRQCRSARGGFFCAGISFIVGIIYFILKLINWNSFQAGIAPMMIAICFIGSIQLIFIGLLGEYIMNINTRVMHRPLVIEEERINFERIE